MRHLIASMTRVLTLLSVGLLAAAGLYANEIAVATYTDSQVSPGVFQYNFTLSDTGTTNIGTFWLGWIPGNGFLSGMPTGIVSAGWNPLVTDHFAILFVAGAPISPGGTAHFQFDSTETPAQMLGTFGGPGPGVGDPVTTFFVYSAGPFSDAGFQSVATPARVVATPEPGIISLMIFALAALGLGASIGKKGSPVSETV